MAATTTSQQTYFETELQKLSESGYGGLKLADVGQQRYDVLYEPALEVLGDARRADVLARWGCIC